MLRLGHTRIKQSTLFLLVILLATTAVFFHLPRGKAQTTIIDLNPSVAPVGTTVELRANITTVNGTYEIFFDETFLTNGSAVGNDVNASFGIPHASAGIHNIVISDVEAEENATVVFTVITFHLVEIIDAPEPPGQLQEGDSVTISVNMTGGIANRTYVANVTVQSPADESYTNLVNVTVTEKGIGNSTTIYPTDFPAAANTNFTGKYDVLFNSTFATASFIVGLTNTTEYHRFQEMNIRALGYQPSENVTVTISLDEEIVHSEENVTADSGGIVYASWTVPSNASIGLYTLDIDSMLNLTEKDPPDMQYFIIPGFPVNITTRNLAGTIVPEVTVEMFEEAVSLMNRTSGPEGVASFGLEVGNYTCDAYFRETRVADDFPIEVTGEDPWILPCNLTSLGIIVVNEAGNYMPEIELYLTPENQTLITDMNGTAWIYSLLPNINYTLNASRYDTQFNTTTLLELPISDWVNVTIVCPTATLQVYLTDGENNSIMESVTVKAYELMGGLNYENETVDGQTVLHCTIGIYRIEVFVRRDNRDIRLNETTVHLFEETQNKSVRCILYGLNVSIKIVDYFGQLVPNANVTLQREDLQYSPSTEPDGVITFNNIIGGDLQIAVYINGQSQPSAVTTSFVDESTLIEVKLRRYIVIAGFLVETSHLTIAIIMVAAVLLILSIEIYRKRHPRPQKESI